MYVVVLCKIYGSNFGNFVSNGTNGSNGVGGLYGLVGFTLLDPLIFGGVDVVGPSDFCGVSPAAQNAMVCVTTDHNQ